MRVPWESFSVESEAFEGGLRLRLAGSLDASAVSELLRAVMWARPDDVVLDIDELDLVDGAGWLGVISCEQRVAAWGGRLRIDHGIRKILELADLTTVIT
jgi:ABC-type transporter Mla MlaB component